MAKKTVKAKPSSPKAKPAKPAKAKPAKAKPAKAKPAKPSKSAKPAPAIKGKALKTTKDPKIKAEFKELKVDHLPITKKVVIARKKAIISASIQTTLFVLIILTPIAFTIYYAISDYDMWLSIVMVCFTVVWDAIFITFMVRYVAFFRNRFKTIKDIITNDKKMTVVQSEILFDSVSKI